MATSNDTLSALPNPSTPMAFLPPELAYQVTISIYMFVGATGIMIWDILNNLHGDYQMIFKHRIGVPTMVYVVSRLGSLGFILSSTIFTTAPTGICYEFEKGLDWLYPIGVPATSLLFFFRVCAVFDRNKYIVGFFGVMWLGVLGGCLTVTQGVLGTNLGPTAYCINAYLAPYISSAAIIPLVNDTLIFLAITWKLTSNSHREYTGVKSLLFGDYLPAFSRALLQDGQVYYLTTVSANLLTLIMLYTDAPVAYRTMFTVPNVMLMNIMACRVFRNTKLGLSKKAASARENGIFPLSIRTDPSSSRSKDQQVQSSISGIEVTKTVELHDDYEYPINHDHVEKTFAGSRGTGERMV